MDEIENAFQTLHLSTNNTAEASHAAAFLAEASIPDVSIRQRLANPTTFRTLIELIECNLNDSLESVDVALRCIGNACIDNDNAREIITELGFTWAIQCLQSSSNDVGDQETPILTSKVLYNICSDYEPAQQRCFREYIHYTLIHFYTRNPVIEREDGTLFIEILFWMCSQKQPDSTNQDPLPETTLTELSTLPKPPHLSLEAEDFGMLLETCLLFIRDASVQQQIVQSKQIDQVWRLLGLNEDRISLLPGDGEDQKLLVPLSASLIWCLSDMAASPDFSQYYDLQSEWISEKVLPFITTIGPSNNIRLITAACQILGNLLWSFKDPETFAYLVHAGELYEPLLEMLGMSPDTELLHSAAGLLTQLTRPSSRAREAIGSAVRARPALECLCRHENTQLKQDGIKLLRALGRDCPANQRHFAELANEVVLSNANTNGESEATTTPMLEDSS